MLLIKNGNVYIYDSEAFERRDILIDKDKILQVDEEIYFENCMTLDADGMWILPGFIDPLTKIGCETGSNKVIKANEDYENLIARDKDLRKAYSKELAVRQKLYKYGITTAGLNSGDANLIGPSLVAYKTYLADKPIAENYARKASIAPMTSRVFYMDDQIRTVAQRAERLKEELRDDETPIFLAVDTKEEILAAINIKRELNIDCTLIGAYENRDIKYEIEGSGCSIILPDQTMFPYSAYKTDIDHYVLMAEAGKNISISYYNPIAVGAQSYLWSFANIIRYGAKESTALRMATINPAKLLGIDAYTGELIPGKQADIAIWTENPMKSFKAKVAVTIIDGEIVYEDKGVFEC